MALPNFICVGAEKGGTSPLFRILVQHKDVFVPHQKETRYFSRHYTASQLQLYETTFFKEHRLEKAVGELTPEYMRFEEVPGRLREALGPELKLIYCLRDPLARAFSHYQQCLRIMEENDSFENAVALEPARLAEDRLYGVRRSYLGGSLYAAQIRRFLDHFPRENMFFMILEDDFVKKRAATMARLFDFLGVGPDPAVKLDVRNSSMPVPRVRFIGHGEKLDYTTKHSRTRLPEGAILFATGMEDEKFTGADRVFFRPSLQTTEFFRLMQERMTRELPKEFAAELYRRYFRDEVGRMEELLGRSLDAWRH